MVEVVYDAGMLIAVERTRRAARLHQRLLDRGVVPLVPATVLAQTWRGPSPVRNLVLRGCRVEPLDEDAARRVGALLAAAGTSDIVDGHVVLLAASLTAAVFTSDMADIRHLAGNIRGYRCEVVPV